MQSHSERHSFILIGVISLRWHPRTDPPFFPKFSSSTSISPEAGFPQWLEGAQILQRYFQERITDYSVHIHNTQDNKNLFNVPSRSAVEGRANWGLPEESPVSEVSPTSETSPAKVTLLIWRQSPTLSLQIGGGTFTNLVLSQEENA